MTTEQVAELLSALAVDTRLTGDAVRVILYVANLGEAGQEHCVKGEDLSIILHAGEKPIRAAIARAVHCGYLTARIGGRAGHKLTLLLPENDAPQGVVPETKSLPQGSDLGNDAPQGVFSSENASPGGVISALVVGEEGDVEQPPIVPLLVVGEAARRKIADERDVLGVAADPLLSYLALRVPAERQAPYVSGVLSLLRVPTLFDWNTNDGTQAPVPRRAEYLADALTDLAASDERKGNTRPVGDFGNLKTKLGVLLRPYRRKQNGSNDNSVAGLHGGATGEIPAEAGGGGAHERALERFR